MSNRLVLSVLLVAILLGAGMWVFWSIGVAAGPRITNVIPSGERLAVIEPAKLEAIVLAGPQGGPPERITRSAVGAEDGVGQWSVTITSPPAGGEPMPRKSWKLNTDRVGGFLRLLQQARTVAEPSEAQLEMAKLKGEQWHTIELIAAAGTGGSGGAAKTTIHLNTRVLGGQVLAQVIAAGTDGAAVATRWAVVSDELMRVMSAGAMPWRETAMLAGVVRDCVGVRIVTGGSSESREIALQRLRSTWRITAPVSGTADGPSIDRVLAALQGLTITDFNEPKPGETPTARDTSWTSSPNASITLDITARNDKGEAAGTREVQLLLGPVADASGRTLLATIDAGATVVSVDAQAFAALPTDPAKYLSKRSSDVVIADVARVEFTLTKPESALPADASASAPATTPTPSQVFTRSSDGWSSQSDAVTGVAPVLLDRERSNEVTAFIETLIKTEALGVLLTEPPTLTRVAGVTLANGASEPLDGFELFKDSTGHLVVLTRATPARTPAWRVYKDMPVLVSRLTR